MEHIEINGHSVETFLAGNGPALLFLHPEDYFTQHLRFLERLSQHFRVVAPRLPGFGQTQLPAGFRSVGDLAYHTLDLIAALTLRDVTLVGASMGGWVALETCVRSTQAIARLALLAPIGVKFGEREDRDFADLYALPAQEGIRLLFNDPGKSLPDYSRLSDDAALEIARDRQSAGFFLWKPYMHNPGLRQWLHRVQVPSLVISGARDGFVVPGHGAALAKALPNGRASTVAAAGHYPQIEQADETADAIIDFAQH